MTTKISSVEENIKIKIDNWTGEYERYVDAMGFERDRFHLIRMDDRGVLTRHTFLGDAKVGGSKNIGELGYTYTEDELREIFKKEILRINQNNHA